MFCSNLAFPYGLSTSVSLLVEVVTYPRRGELSYNSGLGLVDMQYCSCMLETGSTSFFHTDSFVNERDVMLEMANKKKIQTKAKYAVFWNTAVTKEQEVSSETSFVVIKMLNNSIGALMIEG